MCEMIEKEVFRRAKAERQRHLLALADPGTKEFDKWWHGKVAGWFEAAAGDLVRCRSLLGLPPCECNGNLVGGR